MEKIIKTIPSRTKEVYIAIDQTEWSSAKLCRQHEIEIQISALHKNLVDLEFGYKFKIPTYFHNTYISDIGTRNADLNDYLSYRIMGGRMGNGDCMVRYKKGWN